MDGPLFEKCKVGSCPKTPLTGNVMCKEHWMLVPWQMRRHISKFLRKNDMIKNSLWEQLMAEACWHVRGLLKKPKAPPPRDELPGGFKW